MPPRDPTTGDYLERMSAADSDYYRSPRAGLYPDDDRICRVLIYTAWAVAAVLVGFAAYAIFRR